MTTYFISWPSRNSWSFWTGMAGLLCREADHTSPQKPWRGKGCSPFFGVYDWVGQEEAAIRTPMHWRTERGRHFQAHASHATYSLVLSMLLAGPVGVALVVLAGVRTIAPPPAG